MKSLLDVEISAIFKKRAE